MRRLSASGDLWFHARQIPGSHVVIKRGNHKGDFPEDDIRQAASLAAHHSRAKSATRASVVYTDKKYLRKPKEAPPGLVTYSRSKTITVPLNEENLPQLDEDEND